LAFFRGNMRDIKFFHDLTNIGWRNSALFTKFVRLFRPPARPPSPEDGVIEAGFCLIRVGRGWRR
jgi:hypothetical protein